MPRLRYVVALLLVLMVTTGMKHWPESDPIEDSFFTDQIVGQLTYKAACRISQYDLCPQHAPQVRRSAILGEMMNARGVYWYESPIVWLDLDIHGTQQWLTTFHEQVHYIQELNGVGYSAWEEDPGLRCLVEREALTFTNQYAVELRALSFMRSIEEWRDLYKCKPEGNMDTWLN